MKKKIIGIFVCLLLIGTVLPVSGTEFIEKTFVPASVDGNTLYVGGSGPGNYTSIQEAVDDAEDGDTVFVYNGTYYESNITIKNSIFLIGQDKFTTIIDANTSRDCIVIYADNVTVSGFIIQNADQTGIVITSDNNKVTDNIITNNDLWGIDLNGNFNNISNNVVSNHRSMGISCYFSKNTITRNKIINNDEGIHLGGSSILFSKNNISGNNIGISCTATNISVIQNNFLNNGISVVFYRSIIGEIRNKLLDEIINKIINKIFPNLWPDYDPYYKPLRKNTFDGNYWDRPRMTPKPIFGCLKISGFSIYVNDIPFPINWINFDWNPAQVPYDI